MVTEEIDIQKQVEYYMNLPYTMTVKYREEQGGYYVASYVELPDLTMTGATPEDAVKELLAEKHEWFEECLRLGIPIPLPIESQHYSGKVIVRMPPSLHETLVGRAELEGVSFNQYMVSALARASGLDEGIAKGRKEKQTKTKVK